MRCDGALARSWSNPPTQSFDGCPPELLPDVAGLVRSILSVFLCCAHRVRGLAEELGTVRLPRECKMSIEVPLVLLAG